MILAIVSGGMDSAVLLHDLVQNEECRTALSVDYGQRHRREIGYARLMCARLGVRHQIADLRGIAQFLKGSSQSDPTVEVPEGHYADESMKTTVVPNRNMIMLSVAIAAAIVEQCDKVAYACHAGDHTIYPDCRQPFVEAMDVVAQRCHFTPIRILAPYVLLTKADIVRRGADLGVDFAQTYSCYKGGEKHCGKCGTCVERREAFQRAGVRDPTLYD